MPSKGNSLATAFLCFFSIALATTKAQICEYGDIRLIGGSTKFEGRIEVCLSNEWGTVCDDSIESTPAQADIIRTVVCKQLGFENDTVFISVTTGHSDPTTESHFGQLTDPNSVPIHLDDVMCTGEERGLIDCTHDDVGVHHCQHVEDIGISCSPMNCVENTIQLSDGDTYNSGRVELCYNGSWSTVSDLTPEAANVICGQLGFSNTNAAPLSAKEGIGQILSLGCLGNETEFTECTVTRIGSYNHTRDSGVVCGRCIEHCVLNSTCEECPTTTTMLIRDTTTGMETTMTTEVETTMTTEGETTMTTEGETTMTTEVETTMTTEGEMTTGVETTMTTRVETTMTTEGEMTTGMETTMGETTMTTGMESATGMESTMTTQLKETTKASDSFANSIDVCNSCSSGTLTIAMAVVIGVLLVLLLAVTIGWIATCIAVFPRRKTTYNVATEREHTNPMYGALALSPNLTAEADRKTPTNQNQNQTTSPGAHDDLYSYIDESSRPENPAFSRSVRIQNHLTESTDTSNAVRSTPGGYEHLDRCTESKVQWNNLDQNI